MNLPEFRIPLEQGDTAEIIIGPVTVRDPITFVRTPINLTQVGIQMWFTAKVSRADLDANAVIRKTVGVSGGPGGIALNTPATVDANVATVTILPADTDAVTTLPTTLEADVQLLEPSGRKTTIARGQLLILPDVTNA